MSSTVKLSAKSQVTIPRWAREVLDVEPGDRIVLDQDGGRVVIERVPNLEELSARIRAVAKKVPPLTDVDAYYQKHRGSSD